MGDDKVVVKHLDGRIFKGYIRDFSEKADDLILKEIDSDATCVVRSDLLKAIFFVKTFEGNREYNEKKAYGIRTPRGQRTFVKFTDGEGMVGFLESDLPWDKGFFLSSRTVDNRKGFFLLPADDGSNNIRVFIFAHAVQDLTFVHK